MTALTAGHQLRLKAQRRKPLVVAVRVVCAAAALAAAVATVVWNDAYRALEAAGASLTLYPIVGGQTTHVRDIFWVYPNGFAHGFQVTAECTAILIIAPLLILSAVLFALTRAPIWRIGLGTAAMSMIVTVVNEFRLAMIALSGVQWGMNDGYEIAHLFIGSAIGVLGFAAGLTALVLISVGRRSRKAPADLVGSAQ